MFCLEILFRIYMPKLNFENKHTVGLLKNFKVKKPQQKVELLVSQFFLMIKSNATVKSNI